MAKRAQQPINYKEPDINYCGNVLGNCCWTASNKEIHKYDNTIRHVCAPVFNNANKVVVFENKKKVTQWKLVELVNTYEEYADFVEKRYDDTVWFKKMIDEMKVPDYTIIEGMLYYTYKYGIVKTMDDDEKREDELKTNIHFRNKVWVKAVDDPLVQKKNPNYTKEMQLWHSELKGALKLGGYLGITKEDIVISKNNTYDYLNTVINSVWNDTVCVIYVIIKHIF